MHLVVYDQLKIGNNHTKCLVVDGGKYFILGGTGIKDNFTGTGLDGLSKKEYLKAKIDQTEEDAPENLTQMLVAWSMPKGWRDRDVVFHSVDSTAGASVYKQMLLLALKKIGRAHV